MRLAGIPLPWSSPVVHWDPAILVARGLNKLILIYWDLRQADASPWPSENRVVQTVWSFRPSDMVSQAFMILPTHKPRNPLENGHRMLPVDRMGGIKAGSTLYSPFPSRSRLMTTSNSLIPKLVHTSALVWFSASRISQLDISARLAQLWEHIAHLKTSKIVKWIWRHFQTRNKNGRLGPSDGFDHQTLRRASALGSSEIESGCRCCWLGIYQFETQQKYE